MTRIALLSTASLLALACQASPPKGRPPVPTVAPEFLDRFALGEVPTADEVDPIHVIGRSPRIDEQGAAAPSAAIELLDVLTSVEEHFPLILAAEEEIEIAEGKLISARGGFDTKLETDGYFRTEGFRETERVDVSITQPTQLWGAEFKGGYRAGLGDFDFYEEGSQTNEGGEFRLGVTLPLLQGRAIDPRRVDLWTARIERERADPGVLAKRIEVARKATDSYWKWVAAGRVREIAQRLLALADDRTEQLETAVEDGLLAPINLTENQRLVVDRKARLVRAERSLQQAAIALSLFWRDAEGRPQVPGDELLPYDFPGLDPATSILLDDDVDFALAHRPEVRTIELGLDALAIETELTENQLLPQLDVGVYASQDVGDAASTPDDKEDFELVFLIDFELPLQLRKAAGRDRSVRAKLRKLEREAQFQRETIISEVQDARSALVQNWEAIGQARENVRLANELAELERFQLTVGESDLLRVNLREQQAAVAASGYVGVLRDYLRALADYRAVIGVPTVVTSPAVAGE